MKTFQKYIAKVKEVSPKIDEIWAALRAKTIKEYLKKYKYNLEAQKNPDDAILSRVYQAYNDRLAALLGLFYALHPTQDNQYLYLGSSKDDGIEVLASQGFTDLRSDTSSVKVQLPGQGERVHQTTFYQRFRKQWGDAFLDVQFFSFVDGCAILEKNGYLKLEPTGRAKEPGARISLQTSMFFHPHIPSERFRDMEHQVENTVTGIMEDIIRREIPAFYTRKWASYGVANIPN